MVHALGWVGVGGAEWGFLVVGVGGGGGEESDSDVLKS